MPEIKERPILFNGEMVRAILDGRKTVTRREIVPRMKSADLQFCLTKQDDGTWQPLHTFDESIMDASGSEHPITCPFGQVGDRLWVQEAWAGVNLQGAPGIAYRADDDVRDLMEDESFLEDRAFNYSDPRCAQCSFAAWSEDLISGIEGEWLPDKDMPRWASRILLEVTDVRIERLQGITIAEICKEGHARSMYEFAPVTQAFDYFAGYWNSTGGDWDANPWVWAVEFKRVDQ